MTIMTIYIYIYIFTVQTLAMGVGAWAGVNLHSVPAKIRVMCSESVYEFVIVSFIPSFLQPFIHLLHIIGRVTCLQNFSNVASRVSINHSLFTKKLYDI
jgi:hypothetical protein